MPAAAVVVAAWRHEDQGQVRIEVVGCAAYEEGMVAGTPGQAQDQAAVVAVVSRQDEGRLRSVRLRTVGSVLKPEVRQQVAAL